MDDAGTDAFLDHRELLFGLVYNMLGSVADTEDVLQETWLAWTGRAGAEPIENARAYLVRIAVHRALARRAVVDRRRETYVGQWLPEPVVTDDADGGAERAERTEAASMALLVVLETLSPLERAVFVLHDVFGFGHAEIGEMIDRRPAAVRQLAHRARSHIQARRPRYRPDPRLQREVTERFLDAALGGDVEELLAVLAPDVVLWTDGGGKGPATSLEPVRGRARIARLLVGLAPHLPDDLDVRFRRANADASAVLFSVGRPLALFVLDLSTDDLVTGIYSITNPEKLGTAR
ncbi:sigma-70 family RNA polymerase sigma factor [Pseudonocardia sp. TRM90224]|uniref:sigma-70 family RNA polymerase sigma factor n=1 Tax=Pseudonocardia sp. TRM90224 TaxID=2812678 RepID=UPI001E357DAD|nr:sigma-70 family RNA polymerase sigma factor [Pseudonocardia sp. TRM90224]